MPSGPRRLSRAGRGNVNCLGEQGSSSRGAAPTIPTLEPPSLPKHFPFPSTPMHSDLFFDFLMALFAITGAGIQFLHLYRSVWWLPNSFMHTTMHFYLIDPHLVTLIVLIFMRRLYFQIGCKCISKMYSNKTEEDLSFLSRSILTLFYAILIGVLATIVLGNRGKMDIVYLFYPISLYIPIFGLKVRPFFELATWCSNGVPAIHACSSNPADIRRECEYLRTNLLDRLRQIFFTASINAYYGSFIPCCFSQPELVYDRWWNIELGIFIFTGSIIFAFTHLIPLRYFDVLHRAVLHSGTWERVDNDRNVVLVTHEWRDDVLWPGGALVKYNKSVWRAMGDCNSIIPGDRSLMWGYKLFALPSYPLGVVAAFQTLMALYQYYSVLNAIYWYRQCSLGILLFFNFYSWYKLLRDFIVSYSIYKPSEESDDEKDTRSDSQGVAGAFSHKNHKNVKTKTEEPAFISHEQAVTEDETTVDR